MKRVRMLRILSLSLLVCALASAASAQTPEQAPAAAETTAPAAAAAFTAAQLEQMVAPIALYPDSLVTQILMAATYPLEIVEAARWTEKNPGLEAEALEAKLKEQDWDIAVKALCGFPDVLKRMIENLDWTQDLGDAFLAQQSDVLDTVQRMRGKAYEAGNLKTTEQQVVTQQPDKIIVIQPADPQVIYVPTYAPTVVYGGWYYPTYYYPPMYVAPPPGYGMMAFTTGVFWGAALSSNCNWGWGHSDVDINVNHYNNFNRNTNNNFNQTNIQNKSGNTAWKHNPDHRGGVNYKNSQTAQQFGAQGGSNRVTRDQARGYDRAGGAGGTARNTQAANRPAAGRATTPSNAAARTPAARNTTQSQRPSASATSAANRSSRSNPSASTRSSANRDSTFGGSRNPSLDRSASSRGSMSRGGGGMSGGGRMGGGGGGGRMGGGGGRR